MFAQKLVGKNELAQVRFPTPEEVDRELAEWDIVECVFCGRKISMLKAIPVDSIGFACLGGCK